jgi:hypothetical protein
MASGSSVAVCFSGTLRTFLEPHMQWHFIHHLHRPEYDYFLASDRHVNPRDQRLQLLLRNQTTTRLRDKSKPPNCPARQMTRRHCTKEFVASRLIGCYHMLLHAETVEAAPPRQYQYVLRLRPDHLFARLFPSVAVLFAEQSGGRELLLWDDSMALARRAHAHALYVIPQQAYRECASVETWNYVCNHTYRSASLDAPFGYRQVQIAQASWTDIEALTRCPACSPCVDMALITWFASPKLHWAEMHVEPCAVMLERFASSAADTSGTPRPVAHGITRAEFAHEATVRNVLNCTEEYRAARQQFAAPTSAPVARTAEPLWKELVRELFRSFSCKSMYLDVGSNVGVQIRKLFEPHLYLGKDPDLPQLARAFDLLREPTEAERRAGVISGQAFWNTTSLVLPVFDSYFGPAPRCGVCAIGIEPNPRHTRHHVEVQAKLRAAGVGVLWLSETAADVADGNATVDLRWGGGAALRDVGLRTSPVGVAPPPRSARHATPIATLDLARLILFVRELLGGDGGAASVDRNAARAGGSGGGTAAGQLVMKLDIEGAEYRLLPHLFDESAVCAADLIFLEWHDLPLKSREKAALVARLEGELQRPGCSTAISAIDDETFLKDNKPLPSTRICK